jgi:hypothetical protein
MIYLSQVAYPGHRPATKAAVAAWMLDSCKPGMNSFPWVFDDVRTQKKIDLVSFRATVYGLAGKRKISVRSDKAKEAIIIFLEE